MILRIKLPDENSRHKVVKRTNDAIYIKVGPGYSMDGACSLATVKNAQTADEFEDPENGATSVKSVRINGRGTIST